MLARIWRDLALITSAVSVLVSGALVPARGPAVPVAHAATPVSWEYRGFSMPTWSETAYSSSGPALDQLVATGANSVSFVVTWYQSSRFANEMFRTGATASDASLASAMQYANSLGLKTSIKIHVDSLDGEWRARLAPTNPDQWFANYSVLVWHYADLSQQYGASTLVIGAELISLSTEPALESKWRSLISKVRQRFAGNLTYSANWGGGTFEEEYPDVTFWSALDYLGISAYFELASTNTPTVEGLKTSWANIKPRIASVQQQVGKPVLFTEGGYRSADGAARQPWNAWENWPLDTQEQVDCYEAFFQSWSDVTWFAGITFWDWSTEPSVSPTDIGYYPQNKPAQDTIRNWFGATGLRTATPTAPAPGGQSGLRGTYFQESDLTGPVLTRVDPTVNFTWGAGSPDPSVGPDTFSVRWTGSVRADTSEIYTFRTTNDDGVRLWVNGQLVIDDWNPHGVLDRRGSTALQAGVSHPITLEYFEQEGDAVVALWWESGSTSLQIIPSTRLFSQMPSLTTPSPTPSAPPISTLTPSPSTTPTALVSATPTRTALVTGGLNGQYFHNADLTNSAVGRLDSTVNFNWGEGSPDPAISPDTFSVRWTGLVQASATGSYTFFTVNDDGARLWVNNQLLIDDWVPHGPLERSGSVSLLGSQWYPITLEYFEESGGSIITLTYSGPGIDKQIVPSERLSPGSLLARTATPTQTSATLVPTPSPPMSGAAHVGDLDGSGAPVNRNRWRANVNLTVHDAGHQPVGGATVTGFWNGNTSAPVSCSTSSSGQCAQSDGAPRTQSSVSFTVTSISHPQYIYQPSGNHDPDGDSNGTTIIVLRP